MPSGQSAWTFNSARAIAMSSASVLAGFFLVTASSRRLFACRLPLLRPSVEGGRNDAPSQCSELLRRACRPRFRNDPQRNGVVRTRLRAGREPLGWRWRRLLNVLCEYPDDAAFDDGHLVEHVGCNALDGIPQRQELRLPGHAFCSFGAGQFVHRGIADLALDHIGGVQHGEPERQAFGVMPNNSVPGQRHQRASFGRLASKDEMPRRSSADVLPNASTGQKLAEPAAKSATSQASSYRSA